MSERRSGEQGGGDRSEDGDLLFRRPWAFVREVPRLDVLPEADRPEVAFAGRSNVGKSSLINALVGQHDLARASNTPGRTQSLNFFEPERQSRSEEGVRLHIVDMPGYGYAEAPKELVRRWNGLVRDYLRGRPTLARVFLLVDSRHGLKPNDIEIMRLLDEAAVSYQLVLTKVDKVTPSALARVEAAIAAALTGAHPAAFPELLATSSETRAGIDRLRLAVLAAAGLVSLD